MRNHEVTQERELLDERGNLAEPGWSRRLLQRYDRQRIRAPKWRIKEWDYYLVMGRGFAGAFTVSDDGYIGLQSVSLLVLDETPWEHTETVLNAFPMGRLRLPPDSGKGDTAYQDKRLQLRFSPGGGKRRISCRFERFYRDKPFACEIELTQPETESMVIATPWDKAGHFYYNQKINCMRASGCMEYDGTRYVFDPETDFGTLDWGRGVWTYDNTWYWGSGSGQIGQDVFGFNIGYGFGNTKAASENVLFYNGRVHKLDDVTFHIPQDSYMKPWKFTSSDGRFEMDFAPVLDRAAKIDLGLLVSDQHQVFGRMSGRAVLDGGEEIAVKDMMCFAEKVHNRY